MSVRYFVFFLLAATIAARAQTVDGMIFGRVTNETTGESITGAKVTAVHRATGAKAAATTVRGAYALSRLPPGIYDVSVEVDDRYRPSRIERIDLPVAGLVRQDVTVRLITDLFQQNLLKSVVARDQRTVLTFYGPDVDMSRAVAVEPAGTVRGGLEPAVSQMITAGLIDALPLNGRDVYQMIALMPGAVSGLATLRGAAVSVNGQRPSSSNFLLDGVENNNYLITGTFAPLPPEAVEQYRVSTNNFSAEYGRTAGYIANSVTPRGSAAWHGRIYGYGRNEALNANTQDRIDSGLQRQPMREWEAGARVTGPLWHPGLYHSELFDYYVNRTWNDPSTIRVPGPALIAQVTAPASRAILAYDAPANGVLNPDGTRSVSVRRPESLERYTGLERIDWEPSDTQHLTMRAAVSLQSLPDFIWSPYPGFSSPLHQNNASVALGYTRTVKSTLSIELRGSVNRDLIAWDRAHAEIPKFDFFIPPGYQTLTMPGSPANFVFRNRGLSEETHGNLAWIKGRHFLKFGGGLMRRGIASRISVLDATPELTFENWPAFAQGIASSVTLAGSRDAYLNGGYQNPDMSRAYRYTQSFGFVQDSFRWTSRLLIHAGVRYDRFGAPQNVGSVKDWEVQAPAAGTFTDAIAGSRLVQAPRANQRLYSSDNNDWAARLGFAANLDRKGDTLLRGAWGIYYDRPFDNLWLDMRFNNVLPVSVGLDGVLSSYNVSAISQVPPDSGMRADWKGYNLTMYQPGIRTPYTHSFFLGLQQRLSSSALLEVNYAGSQGRDLIVTDRINRSQCANGSDSCRPNPGYQTDIDYRSNAGTSFYNALTASLQIRGRRTDARLNYTWSHAIDNQSDPLQGLVSSNLEVASLTGGAVSPRFASFTVESDGSVDRANADFDQRQSLTGFIAWQAPRPSLKGPLERVLSNWRAAALGAVRSGTPYTIYAGNSALPLWYNRPDLIDPGAEFSGVGAVPGGRQLLNPAAFADPKTGSTLGNVGRNAFRGPSFQGLDVSLSREFAVRAADRAARMELRVDFYNVLNHANLSNPNTLDESAFLGSANFGVARYGRSLESGGPLSFLPLAESNRTVQLLVRLSF